MSYGCSISDSKVFEECTREGVDHPKEWLSEYEVCCDSDWASCANDKRFTSGYFLFIGGNLISWKSKKQSIVVRSVTEVEFNVMALGVVEML
jgi:hypothetical protein